jgi:hypothetical protein
MIDLCAMAENKKYPVFVSPFPHPQAWAVDALSLDLNGLEAYVFPPYQLIGKLLKSFRQYSCTG